MGENDSKKGANRMEICRYAEAKKAQDQSLTYYCSLHGYKMGLELGHFCQGCEEYAVELAAPPAESPRARARKPAAGRLPCAVCRFRPTCRLRERNQSVCPFFSQK